MKGMANRQAISGAIVRAGCAILGALAALSLASCTVVPIDEAEQIRKRQSGLLDIDEYTSDAWARSREVIAERAVTLAELIASAPDEIGPEKGNRPGEGSPFSFFVKGDGTVREVATDQPRGQILLDTASGTIVLEVGPVVAGTAIRDALPFITFDEVADQTAYAGIGLSLTRRALGRVQPELSALKPGDRISFTGATSLPDGNQPLLVTPITITSSSLPSGSGQ